MGDIVAQQKRLKLKDNQLADIASEAARNEAEQRIADWTRRGVPDDLAEEVALLPLIALIPDIASVSRETGRPLEETVESYFEITRLFEIGRLEAALFRLDTSDYFETLALQRAEGQIARARRQLTTATLKSGQDADAWARERQGTVERIRGQLVALPVIARTSAARYVAEGWFRRGRRNLWCLLRYLAGADPHALARSYRRSSRRS